MSVESPPDTTGQALRDALGCYATGVAIVTTATAAGHPAGMTVNSFASVSLDPPLVLWSARRGVSPFDAFEQASHYAVHVLGEHQRALSGRFARPGGEAERFEGVAWAPGLAGLPLIEGTLARFQCRVVQRHAGGDHLILVAEVLDFERGTGAPLVFQGGGYRSLAG